MLKTKIYGLTPGTRVPERQRPAIVGTGRAGVKAIAASQYRLEWSPHAKRRIH
jgi:hypothetical protein